jgi:hypothetical protein
VSAESWLVVNGPPSGLRQKIPQSVFGGEEAAGAQAGSDPAEWSNASPHANPRLGPPDSAAPDQAGWRGNQGYHAYSTRSPRGLPSPARPPGRRRYAGPRLRSLGGAAGCRRGDAGNTASAPCTARRAVSPCRSPGTGSAPAGRVIGPAPPATSRAGGRRLVRREANGAPKPTTIRSWLRIAYPGSSPQFPGEPDVAAESHLACRPSNVRPAVGSGAGGEVAGPVVLGVDCPGVGDEHRTAAPRSPARPPSRSGTPPTT